MSMATGAIYLLVSIDTIGTSLKNNVISRTDGAILLIMFIIYMYYNLYNVANITENRRKKKELKKLGIDVNKTKEYLFSLSTYKTLIEIYDIENNYIYRNITEIKFINGIFSFQFPILELVINNQNNYICIYTHDSSGNTYGYGDYYSIKRFYINENKEVIIMNSTRSNNANLSSRTIAGFLDENNFIYVIFLSDSNKISICKYDIVLNYISRQILVSYSFYYADIFQSLYLKNNLAALIYFSGGYSTISVIFAVFN